MKMTDRTCPRLLELEPYSYPEVHVKADGAVLESVRIVMVGKKQIRRVVRLKLTDHQLRRVADGIEAVAAAREARAKFLRRQS